LSDLTNHKATLWPIIKRNIDLKRPTNKKAAEISAAH